VCTVEDDCPRNCTCIKRPSNLTFSVSCQSGTHVSLPERLPNPDHPPPRVGRFQLDFSKSNIRTLEFRHYLNKTVWIDVSKSDVVSVRNDAWKALSRIDQVDLSGNQLTVLPKFLASENITFRWLAIYENPLRCNCEDRWIRHWLLSLGNGLFTPCYHFAARCGSPDWLKDRNVLEMTDKDFCTNPNRERIQLIVEVCEPLAIVLFPVNLDSVRVL